MADKQTLYRVEGESVGNFKQGDVVFGHELGDSAGVEYLVGIGKVSEDKKAKGRSVAADRTEAAVDAKIAEAVKDKAEEAAKANARVAELEAEVAKLEKNGEALREAFGLVSTLAPSVAVDADNVGAWAKAIEADVQAEMKKRDDKIAELEKAVEAKSGATKPPAK